MHLAPPALSKNPLFQLLLLLSISLLYATPSPSAPLPANTASISGTKWNDANGNGLSDAGENGMENWIIYLDQNENGQRDQGEPFTLTDILGRYTFAELAAGDYIVAEEQQDKWQQTFPDNLPSESPTAQSTPRSAATLTRTASKAPMFTYGQSATPRIIESANLSNLNALRADPRFSDIKGKDFAVAILDTGIDLDHPFFGPDQDENGIADRIVYSYDFANSDSDASDHDGHGSNVSSIIASESATYEGIAPEANIIHLKVFGDNGSGDFEHLEDGLQWVINNASAYNIVAVNMSLGDGFNYTSTIPRHGIGDEISLLGAMGLILTSASGNDFYTYSSQEGIAYPAADDDVLAVGAVYDGDLGAQTYSSGARAYSSGSDRVAPFTQRHSTLLDILAPGAIITGANHLGGTEGFSGTSQACPHITGYAVLAQQIAATDWGRRMTPTEFASILKETASAVYDGDDEDDNVTNTNRYYPRADVHAMAVRIYELGIMRGAHRVALTEGETVQDIDFGNQSIADLTPPESVSATDGDFFDKVRITWTAADDDDIWFRVYRSPSPTGTKLALGNWQKEAFFNDTTATPEIIYHYYVRKALDSSGIVTGNFSAPDTGWRYKPPPLSAPQNLLASDGTFLDKVELNWDPVVDGNYYRTLRATNAMASPDAQSDWIASKTFHDTTAVPDYPYYYYVQAASDNEGSRESPLSAPTIGRRGLDSSVPAPTSIEATDGEFPFQVRISWYGSARSSYFRLYRSESPTAPLTLISDWQTEREYDDFEIEQDKSYYYTVQAAASADGQDAGPISGTDRGYAEKSDELHLKITAKNCTLNIEQGALIKISNTLPNATLKIQKLKNPPKEVSSSPRVGYLSPVFGIPHIAIDGGLKKLSSAVAIGSITATGMLKSVTAKPCRIDTMQATSFRKIKMTEPPQNATSTVSQSHCRIIATAPATPSDPPRITISLTGLSVAELHAPAYEITLKASAKTGKNAYGIKSIRIADTIKTTAKSIRKFSIKGGSITGPITATGTISNISVKTMRAKIDSITTRFGGQIGTASTPVWIAAGEAASTDDPQGNAPILINKISANQGVCANIICGYDTRPDLPSFTGALGSIKTWKLKKGSAGISGKACVHNTATGNTKLKGDPFATDLQRFTFHSDINTLLPENDVFSNAISIQGPNGQATASNAWASRQQDEPPHAIKSQTKGKSLWWNWRPTQSGLVTFDTSGSNFDTLLAVYTGDDMATLMPVVWNDNTSLPTPTPLTSRLTFNAEAGQTYKIAVDGAFHNDMPLGNVTLNWTTDTR